MEKVTQQEAQRHRAALQEAEAKVQVAEAKMQEAEAKVQVAEAKVQEAEAKVQEAKAKVQEAQNERDKFIRDHGYDPIRTPPAMSPALSLSFNPDIVEGLSPNSLEIALSPPKANDSSSEGDNDANVAGTSSRKRKEPYEGQESKKKNDSP